MNLQNKFLGSEANFFAEIIVNYRLLCNFAQSNVPLFLRDVFDDARTKNYLLFKANDGARHSLALTATLNKTTIKTPYDVKAKLKKIGAVEVYLRNLENCAVNVSYYPEVYYTYPSVDAAAVYDYWLTLAQDAKNLKNAQLYGVEIDPEGHTFKYTKDQGVNNSIEFVYNYILMDGTIVEGDKDAPHFIAYMREEMAASHEITLDRLVTPMDAKFVNNDNPLLNSIASDIWRPNQLFALNTEAYDISKMINGMSDIEKLVWNSAVKHGNVTLELIGGEGENNEDWANFARGYNICYAIVNNTITFQFLVSEEYHYNFLLNNAYQLTLTVNDEDTKTPVASVILPFEFTQPTLDITRVNGEKAIWNNKGTELRLYGDLVDNDFMYAPMFEAFTTAYAKKYSSFVPNARYYTLSHSNDIPDGVLSPRAEFLGHAFMALENAPLNDIVYSAKASEWCSWTSSDYVAAGYKFPIKAAYKFYGVYPATKAQVPDFTVKFSSLLGDAKTVKAANSEIIVHNVTREIVLIDKDFTLVDALGNPFYLFDGVKADGNIDNRSDMNLRQGFEENTEGFATSYKLANADATAYYYKDGSKVSIPVTVGTANLTGTIGSDNATLDTNTSTKTRTWKPGAISASDVIITNIPAVQANKPNYAAIPGGVMIQIPSSIGTTEPVTIDFKLVDVFGATKKLSVTVKAAK